MNRECYSEQVYDISCNGGSDMKNRLRTLVLLILFFLIVGGVRFLDLGSNPSSFSKNTLADDVGPVVSNFYLDPSDSDTYSADYQGLVEIDAVDADGVDIVWLQYHWEDEVSWSHGLMESEVPFHNDTYSGTIRGTLKPGDNRFFVKFFANDTLGNLSESEVFNRTVYYMHEEGPTPFLYYLAPILALFCGAIAVLGIWFWRYKKRR